MSFLAQDCVRDLPGVARNKLRCPMAAKKNIEKCLA